MSAQQDIQRLILQYAALVDRGDFEGLGELFADGAIVSGNVVQRGADAVRRHFESTVRRFGDGTPHTRHVTTNIDIVVDEQAGTAHAESYVTVFFQPPGRRDITTIFAGGYSDEFHSFSGTWRFSQRTYRKGLIGDMTDHVL